MESTSIALKYRYPGVKPFTTEEQSLFFGRENDINDLYRLISLSQIVVVYGKSGCGKSSLIDAGIIPKLQTESQSICFKVRFGNYIALDYGISPVDNVQSRIREALQYEMVLSSPLDNFASQEKSFWYWLKSFQWQRQQTQFIFFFDQFEELFTYPQEQVKEFSTQLAELLYVTIPTIFRKRMNELDERGQLNDEVSNFLFEKPEVKVVFLVRSDRLSLLNALTQQHYTILRNCYELDALDRDQAKEAIIKPAQSIDTRFASPPFGYTSDAVEKVLDNIADPKDGKIESATLQMICRYIEDELVGKNRNVHITHEDLGDITDIFQNYYERMLDRLHESDRSKAQMLIEDELIANGRRNPLSETYIYSKFNISPDLLFQLEASSLLRRERDTNGRLLYEVSHDTLVAPIERVALARREKERLQFEKRQREQLTQEAEVAHRQAQYARQQAEEFKLLKERAERINRLSRFYLLISIMLSLLLIFLIFKQRI